MPPTLLDETLIRGLLGLWNYSIPWPQPQAVADALRGAVGLWLFLLFFLPRKIR